MNKTLIEMAQEIWFDGVVYVGPSEKNLERFAELVLADEKEKYKWDVHSCGPTCKRYACVAMREAMEASRNATLDEIANKIEKMPFGDTAASFAVWIKEQKT